MAQKLEGILLNGNEDLPLSLFKNLELPSLRLLQMIEMMTKFVKVFMQFENYWACFYATTSNDYVWTFKQLTLYHNFKKGGHFR